MKLTTKQAIETALIKDIEAPDEASGLVLHRASVLLNTEDEFSGKRATSEKDLTPTSEEMDLINASAGVEQDPGDWLVFRGVNVTGPLETVDSHGDMFSMKAAKTMASQVTPEEASPIITDHWHELGDKPPVGKAIAAKATKNGVIETWAIPKDSYNADVVKGLLRGTINKISIGAFISPADKQCNSCKTRSIYSMDCPHIPLRNDEEGKQVTVTIKDVKRYAERSLVNIPARMGTSVKSLAPDTPEITKEDENPFTPSVTISEELLNPSKDDMVKAFQDNTFGGGGATHPSEKEESTTINLVINGDSIVADTKSEDQVVPEVEAPKEAEPAVVEAPAEEAPEAVPEVKSIEVPVVKALEVEELTKSVVASLKLDVESLNKALGAQEEKFNKLAEMQTKSTEDLGALSNSVLALTEQVTKAVQMSSEETLEKLLDVASQLKEQIISKAPAKPADFLSFVDTLVK